MPKQSDLARQILSIEEPSDLVPVSVPEWGLAEGLFLRPASVDDLDAYSAALAGLRFGGCSTAVVVGRLLVDGDGRRVFTDDQIADLAKRRGSIVNRIAAVAMDKRLLGRGPDDDDEEGAAGN